MEGGRRRGRGGGDGGKIKGHDEGDGRREKVLSHILGFIIITVFDCKSDCKYSDMEPSANTARVFISGTVIR